MANGREIKQIYDAMKRICSESSQMLKVIRDNFDEKSFKCLNASKVMWDTSKAIDDGTYWLPYFQQLLFVPKDQIAPKKALGVNILFDEPGGGIDNVIPFVTCGLLSWEKGSTEKTSNHLWGAGWWDGDEPPRPKTTFSPPLYRTVFAKSGNDCEKITYYLLPLDELKSENTVVSLIVKPLLDLYKGEDEKVRSAVRSVAITLEEVKGEPVAGE
jgi:hypothetical protein